MAVRVITTDQILIILFKAHEHLKIFCKWFPLLSFLPALFDLKRSSAERKKERKPLCLLKYLPIL